MGSGLTFTEPAVAGRLEAAELSAAMACSWYAKRDLKAPALLARSLGALLPRSVFRSNSEAVGGCGSQSARCCG
jgi:hypothetical protein